MLKKTVHVVGMHTEAQLCEQPAALQPVQVKELSMSGIYLNACWYICQACHGVQQTACCGQNLCICISSLQKALAADVHQFVMLSFGC